MLSLFRARFIHLIMLGLLVTACGKKDSGNATGTSSGNPAEGTVFQGTIRAKQWIQNPLNTFEITYTVGKDQIRRESKSTNVIDKVMGSTTMGVICWPHRNEVILYCSALDKKRFCRLTLEEYRELSKYSASGQMPYHGYGRIYLNRPEDSACQITNTKDHSTIEGRKCDRHELAFKDDPLSVSISTDHTRHILVPRELLILAEPNVPESITGFPVRVRRIETVEVLQQAGSQPEPEDKYKKWLVKAAKLASDGLKKALESGLDILQVEYGAPDISAFELTPDYTEVADLTAYETEFRELESSSGDIDDDD